ALMRLISIGGWWGGGGAARLVGPEHDAAAGGSRRQDELPASRQDFLLGLEPQQVAQDVAVTGDRPRPGGEGFAVARGDQPGGVGARLRLGHGERGGAARPRHLLLALGERRLDALVAVLAG